MAVQYFNGSLTSQATHRRHIPYLATTRDSDARYNGGDKGPP